MSSGEVVEVLRDQHLHWSPRLSVRRTLWWAFPVVLESSDLSFWSLESEGVFYGRSSPPYNEDDFSVLVLIFIFVKSRC